ncbi:MAG: DUF1570 domain-containing protein, partial [Planctomycetota bacterium]|nr:DUF1570 domain-containing protein [Planctomycetota bacterium]
LLARSFVRFCVVGRFGLWCVTVGLSAGFSAAHAVDLLEVDVQGETIVLRGHLLESGEPETLLLLNEDNTLQKVPRQDVLKRQSDRSDFEFSGRDKFVESLRIEFGREFNIHQTSHYIICFNTVPEYAKWVGTLLERLHRAYYAYWGKRRGDLQAAASPLVVIVHRSQSSFRKRVEGELGVSSEFIPGYYNQESNRINLYDLSGLTELQEKMIAQGRRPGSSIQQIRSVLSHPTAERNVATIIHEGTHQLSFNSGMMRRLSQTPLWLSEGMAIYFETPDLGHAVGWSAIGSVNQYNLKHFQYLARNGELLELEVLLGSDDVFRSSETVRAAYAQSWALNYFLQKTRPEHYRSFVKMQRFHPPLKEVPVEKRLSMFISAFGSGLSQLEKDFLNYMQRLP